MAMTSKKICSWNLCFPVDRDNYYYGEVPMKIRQMILMLIDLLFFAPLALQSSVDGFQPQSSVEPSKLQRVDMG